MASLEGTDPSAADITGDEEDVVSGPMIGGTSTVTPVTVSLALALPDAGIETSLSCITNDP